MLYLKDFVGTERYKKSIYFLYKDAQGEPIFYDVSIITQICPILLWEDQPDGGVIIKFALYNEIPKGYKLWKDAPKAPLGYEWIHAKETTETERRMGLLKLKVDEDFKYPNLSKCSDYKILLNFLTNKNLSEIENILASYTSGKIQLVIPRNENGEVEWMDDWKTTIIDSNYESTGSETLVLKWYEGFEDTGYLIGYRGEVLNSIQTIVTNVASKSTKEKVKVLVNIGKYREKREKDLQNLAQKIAGTVIKTRKEIVLEPMTAYERKIIHTKLQENDKVKTHSIGEEPYRKIVVSLK